MNCIASFIINILVNVSARGAGIAVPGFAIGFENDSKDQRGIAPRECNVMFNACNGRIATHRFVARPFRLSIPSFLVAAKRAGKRAYRQAGRVQANSKQGRQ